MPGSTFSAMAITAFGPAECLQPVTRSLPAPQAGEVLIRLLAAAVNPIDVKTRAGLGWAAAQNADNLPWVPGYDGCGEIVALGEGVSEFSLGQRVVGMMGFPLTGGCYADYVVSSGDDVVPISMSADFAQAAGLPLAGLTAWQALFEHGQLKAGDNVVISAASGGVGHLAVQLASQAGARVTALASAKHHHRLAELGADVVIDYSDDGQLADIADVDLWLDLIGGHVAIHQFSFASGIVRLVTVPTVTADEVIASAEKLGATACGMLVHPDRSTLAKLISRLENSQLCLNICKQYPLEQAVVAHQLVESGQAGGKVILIP